MKKILSAVIAVLMITAVCCTLVGCGSVPTEGLQYTLNSDGQSYSVSGIGSATSTVIVIDNTYESLPVTAIADEAFCDNTGIVSVRIPETVETIGSSAFCKCSSLSVVTFANNSKLTSLSSSAFYECEALSTILLPESLTFIGAGCFFYCTSLTSITIPDSVTKIDYFAFNFCTRMTNVSFGSNSQLENIANYAFSMCTSLTSIDIGSNVSFIGEQVFNLNTSLKSIDVAVDNQYYTTISDSLYSADGTELIQYALGKTTKTFVVPESVTSIRNCAFYGAENLQSVTIGSNVTSLGFAVFRDCTSLTSITFPEGSEWYRTVDGDQWIGRYGGTHMDTSNAELNAVSLTGYLFTNFYWYSV